MTDSRPERAPASTGETRRVDLDRDRYASYAAVGIGPGTTTG